MSSISLSLKMMLAATACAGLTLLACGDESSGGGDDETGKKDDDDKKSDAGKKTDAGKKADAGFTIPMVTPGDECDTSDPIAARGGRCDDDACDKAPCISQCEDGVYGECQSSTSIIDAIRDSGILSRDGGFQIPGLSEAGIVNKDGSVGITIGDAMIDIPKNACPAEFECSTVASSFGFPNVCATPGGLFPPTCKTQQDCADMGFKGVACAAIPVLSDFAGGNLCLSPCE